MYSYTALSLYEQCPHRYRIERVEGRKPAPTRPLLVGQAVHAAIAAYLRHLQAERLATDVTWADAALDEAAREVAALDSDGWAEVGEVFRGFVLAYAFEPERIAEVEKREAIPLAGDEFWAVIDLLEITDGTPRLRDWKTNWNVPTPAETDRDFQLRCYAWAVHRLYGYEEVECVLEYVRHGVSRSVVVGPEEIERTEKRLLGIIEKLQTEQDWVPHPGHYCSWCPWAAECPAGADTGGDPAAMAGRILVLESELKALRQQLAAWCAENGLLEVGGEVFGYLSPKDGSWTVTDKAAFSAALSSLGYDPWEYLSVNGTKLRSLRTAKKHAAAWAAVMPYVAQEVKVTFGHRRKEGEA